MSKASKGRQTKQHDQGAAASPEAIDGAATDQEAELARELGIAPGGLDTMADDDEDDDGDEHDNDPVTDEEPC